MPFDAGFMSTAATGGTFILIFYGVFRHIRSDMEDLRKEFRNDMEALRKEFRKDMEGLRNEFRADMKALFDEAAHSNKILHDRIDRQENRMFQLVMGKSFKQILAEERTLENPEEGLSAAITGVREKQK